MRTLITYYSRTGNTKKIADEIFNVISGEKDITKITELDLNSLSEYDLIFLGTPVKANSVESKVKKVLKTFPDNLKAKIGVFITHGVPDKNFYEGCFKAIKKACNKKNLEVIEEFNCLGKHSSPDLVVNLFPDKAEDVKKSIGHPDQTDLENVKKFALDLMEKL